MPQRQVLRSSQSGLLANTVSTDHDHPTLLPIALQYWESILRRKWLILAIFSISLTLGFIYTILQPNRYTATARIEISRISKNITNVQGVEQDVANYDIEFYDTQYALLRSQSLAERVVRQLGLANDPKFFEAQGVKISQEIADLKRPEVIKAREQMAAGMLLSGLAIEPVRNSSLVDIRYSSGSPEWSAKIANAWPEQFIASNLDRRLSATSDARRMLEERLETLRIKLEESEQRLIAFANSRNIIVLASTRGADGKTTDSRSLVANNLEVLNNALMQARAERIATESRARASTGDATSEVMQSQALGSLRAKRAELAADYSRILVQFEPGYPAAVAIKAQIDAVDVAIAQETARANRGRRISFDEALQREASLEQQVEKLKDDYRRQQEDTIQYNIYQREVDTNRQLYDGLLQRYKEIGVAGTVEPSNILVVDGAKVPGAPSGPSLLLNLLVAVLIGAGFAVVLVLILEQLDDAIRSTGDIEQKVGLPLLGSIPTIADDPVEVLANPKSSISEAYFSVRATLALATTHGFPKSLAVTSTQPGEGKSTTALAIAAILSRTGRKVVLVDADMRSPSVHKFAGRQNTIGLSNLLAGDDDIDAVIAKESFRGFAIISAGPMPPSAAELLSSDRLEMIIGQLAGRFDHVIIDSPPIIGLADAPLVARAAEGCVFVVEASKTSLRAARNALKRLKVGKNIVFGAVATKIDNDRFGYGYDYSYRYHYGEID